MSGTSAPAVELFERLARETWEKVRLAHTLGLRIGEETLTDLLFLSIREAALPEVAIVPVAKHREAIIGADWDWWIGHDTCGWIRYAVQAKKLRIAEEPAHYGSFRHEVKDGNEPKFQIDRLEKYAAVTRSAPIYCLYNGGVSVAGSPFAHAGEAQFGCTIAPFARARMVHDRRARRTFECLHERRKEWQSGRVTHVDGAFPLRYLLLHHCSWLRRVAEVFPRSPSDSLDDAMRPRLPDAVSRMIDADAGEHHPGGGFDLYPEGGLVPGHLIVTRVSDQPSES